MFLQILKALGLSKGEFRRLLLIVLLSGSVICIGRFVFDAEHAVKAFRYSAYWFTGITVALWGYVGYRLMRSRPAGESGQALLCIRELPWLIVVVIITIIAVFVQQEPGFKIVNDEPSQLATAKSLFESHEAAVVYRSYDVGAGLDPTHSVVDKRPILYAWVVAQTHALTGYRESNGFWVSRFMAIFTTLALYAMGRRMAGPAGGAILALLMLLPTMQAHLANAGGFEMMNLLFIILLGLAICWYLERSDEWSEAWLVLTFVMLCGLRYESVIFALPVIFAVLMMWRRGVAPKLGIFTLISPILVLPRLWLQSVFSQGDSWQLQSKPEAAGDPFSYRFFYDNIGHALSYFFSFDPASTNSVLLAGLGLGCAGFWIMLISRKLRVRADETWSFSQWGPHVLWLGLGAHFLLMMVYFWGQFDDTLTQRLALPVHLWLALPVVGIWATLKNRERWSVPVIAGLVLVFLTSTAPQLNANRFYNVNNTARAHNKVRKWMSENPSDSRLVIDNVAMPTWLAGNNAVVSTKAIRAMPDRIRYQWKRQTFNEVLAMRREAFDPRTAEWTPLPDDSLGPDFDDEEVWTLWCSPVFRFRLVRITAIRNDYPDWQPTELSSAESAALWRARGEYIPEWAEHMP